MPVHIEFKLVGKTDIPLAPFCEEGVLGIVKHMVREDSGLLNTLDTVDHGYLTTALFAGTTRKKNQVIIPAEKPFRLVFTALDESLGKKMSDFVTESLQQNSGFDIGGSETLILPLEETYGFIEQIGYTQILQVVQPEAVQGIEFISPSLFEISDRTVVLPDARLVYGCLRETWNRNSGIENLPEIEDYMDGIKIKRFNLQSKALDFGCFRHMGFMGNMVFDMSSLGNDIQQIFSVLTAFSWFAGTGSKKWMGLGQSKPMPVENLVSQEKPE